MAQSQCILVVADKADQRDLYAAMLAHEGVRIIAYSSPIRALGFLSTSETCALAFSDDAMREMGGLEFAREARRFRPEIPIVLATTHEAVADRALANGYCALLKPVTPDALVRMLNEHLNRG